MNARRSSPMTISEGQCAALEAEGWTVTAGIWTAEGHRVLLRRGAAERILTVLPDEPEAQEPFLSTEKTPGAGAVEVTNNHANPAPTGAPGRGKVTMTAKLINDESPALPGEMILDATVGEGRRLLHRIGPNRYLAARVKPDGRIGCVRRLGLRAALIEAVSIDRDWHQSEGVAGCDTTPLFRDAARALGGAR